MSLACDVLVDSGIAFTRVAELQDVIAAAADATPEMPSGAWTLTIRIVADCEIARLHAEFFSDPSPTDVISFPSGDALSQREGHLGDVAISFDTAAFNAADAGHATDREVAFLALHGLLHLLGHEDATVAQRTEMLALQSQLLDAFDSTHAWVW